MDQMANWVRFADTKATILAAGFGVVLTMLMTNAKTVATTIKQGYPDAYIVGILPRWPWSPSATPCSGSSAR